MSAHTAVVVTFAEAYANWHEAQALCNAIGATHPAYAKALAVSDKWGDLVSKLRGTRGMK